VARLLLVMLLLVSAGCAPSPEAEAPDPPTIAAAASLRNVMPDLVAAWGDRATVTYGGSGTLRRQVEAGAPIDVVVFAAAAPVDALIEKHLADAASREVLASNELVLVGPRDQASELTWATLGDLPADAKLAVGEPAAVPAGDYAKQALEGLGSWDGLKDRVVFAGDVAMVLAYARRGEVAAAAVYATDVAGVEDLSVLDRATWEGAPRPEVVAASVSSSDRGRAFLTFLATPAARAVFQKHGFGPP